MEDEVQNSQIEERVLDLAKLFGLGLFLFGISAFINEFEEKYYLQDVVSQILSYQSTRIIIIVTGIATILASLITYLTKEVTIENNAQFLQKVLMNWLGAAAIALAPILIIGKTINRTLGSTPRIEKFYVLYNSEGVSRITGDIDNHPQTIEVAGLLDDSLKSGDSIQLTSKKGFLGYTHSLKYKGELIEIDADK